MAKDGTTRGGNRIGAGRKGKSRKDKILDGTWIIVNKVDKKSERGEKFRFKIIRRKKMDGRMRTFGIVKTVNVLEQGKL